MGDCNFCTLRNIYQDKRYKGFQTVLLLHPHPDTTYRGIFHVYQVSMNSHKFVNIPESTNPYERVPLYLVQFNNDLTELRLTKKFIDYFHAFMLAAWANDRGVGFFSNESGEPTTVSTRCAC